MLETPKTTTKARLRIVLIDLVIVVGVSLSACLSV